MRWLIYLIILPTLAICFASCRTQYIPIETVRTEYKTRDSVRFDSIYRHDSITMYVRGDTVYKEKYKYLYRYLTISKADTIIRADSIQIPFPIEKKLTRWQSLKMELGGWAFGIIAIFIMAVIVRFICYLRNK